MYEKIETWRERPIESRYPYVYLDGLFLKQSWGGEVHNIAVLVAIGVAEDGYRDVLGAYLDALESHKPKRGRKRTPESMKKRLNVIESEMPEADPMRRLQLVHQFAAYTVEALQLASTVGAVLDMSRDAQGLAEWQTTGGIGRQQFVLGMFD